MPAPLSLPKQNLLTTQTEFIDDSNIQGSNAVSSDETGMDVEALESSNSTSKRIIVTTTAPVIYVFSSSSLSMAAVSNSDDAGQSTTTPTSLDVVDHDGNYQYSAGTVTPNEERSDIESTALELSTSPDQVDDNEGKTPFTSTRSTASSGKKATSTSDQATSSDHDNNGGDNFHVATSNSAQSSPTLYACIVLGVAGVVGAVFAFRTKRKRNVSEEWRVTAEASAMTPRMLRRASWAPPASQVHVIIDDHNFALL